MSLWGKFLSAGLSLVILSACGGGGGATPPPSSTPVSPTPTNTELYIGYYTENSTEDPNDPTPGVLYMYLPAVDASFSGEFFFSYVGCLGSFDTGKLNGAKTGSSFSGTWSGSVDGNPYTGTFTSTGSGASSYSGSWTNDAGTKQYSFGTAPNVCGYTSAGKGDFTIYKIASGTFTISVDLSNQSNPVFNHSLKDNTAAAMKLNVFDKACLINGGGVSSCAMWEYNAFNSGGGSLLPMSTTYGVGSSIPATALVSGNTYIVTTFTYDVSGRVIDFGSTEFTLP